MWLQSCVCEAQDEEKSKTEIVGRAHIPPTFLPVDNEQTVKQPRVGVRCADRASAELFFTVVAFPPAFFCFFSSFLGFFSSFPLLQCLYTVLKAVPCVCTCHHRCWAVMPESGDGDGHEYSLIVRRPSPVIRQSSVVSRPSVTRGLESCSG